MQGGLDAVYGLLDMSAEEYHADPSAGPPSLSASIAHVLLSQSAAHAWHRHPRLNPDYRPERSEAFDLGNVAHAYILQGERHFAVIEAEDWRAKAAREARDAARASGQLPILAHQMADVQAMAQAVSDQLERFADRPRPLANGRPEQTLIWREGDVVCRARLDWLHENRRTIDDLKTTGASANPDAWIRGPLFGSGYDVQAAMYLRGLNAVFGLEGTFRFVVVENRPPYALSVIALGPAALELAHRKVDRAITLWRHCLSTGEWPGFPRATCYADPLPWDQARFEEREWRESAPTAPALDDGRPIGEQIG
jgi:hypothetical protein